jgi:hypothetical protein
MLPLGFSSEGTRSAMAIDSEETDIAWKEIARDNYDEPASLDLRSFLADAWRGDRSLAQVFWGAGIMLLLFRLVTLSLVDFRNEFTFDVVWIVYLCSGIFWIRAVQKCSPNCDSATLASLARGVTWIYSIKLGLVAAVWIPMRFASFWEQSL